VQREVENSFGAPCHTAEDKRHLRQVKKVVIPFYNGIHLSSLFFGWTPFSNGVTVLSTSAHPELVEGCMSN
jgi:hypothetical protein